MRNNFINVNIRNKLPRALLSFFVLSLVLTLKITVRAEAPMIDRGDGYAVGGTGGTVNNKDINDMKEGALDIYNFIQEISNATPYPTSPFIPTGEPQTSFAPTFFPTYSPQNINGMNDLNFATLIVNTIQNPQNFACDGGYVSAQNASRCLSTISSYVKSATIDKLMYSATTHRYLQCVGCADAMAYERGRALSTGASAAKHYLNLNLNGYQKVINTGQNYRNVRPGSLFITTDGTYGHIGYVVDVAPDFSWFQAFECNAPRDGFVRLQRWLMSSPAGWQVPI